MNLIILNGQTATGKTTVARRLAKDLDIGLHLTDEWKETHVFDTYPSKPSLPQLYRAEKRSRKALFAAVSDVISTDTDLIIEGIFTAEHRKSLSTLLRPNTRITEIFFYARGLASYRRYVARYKSGERHPSHRDNLIYWFPWLEGISGYLGWQWMKPLNLSGSTILRVDTTDLGAVDYTATREFVSKHLKHDAPQ